MAGNDNTIAEIAALLNPVATATEEIQAEDTTIEAEEVIDAGAEAAITEGEIEEEEEAGDEERSDGGDEPRTFKQLAEAIDVDVDYLYGIEVGMGDNQEPIPVGQLKDKYQESVRANTQLQEKLDTQSAEMETAQAGMQEQLTVSNEMQQARQAIYQVNKEFNDIDWQRFEAEQPGEAALARQKFMEQHQQANAYLNQVGQKQQQTEQQGRQAMGAKLMELVPEWKQEDVRKAEQAEIRTLLLESGYTDAMLKNASDPIAISLVRRLIKAEKQINGAGEEVKKVRKAPKVLRSKSGRFAAPPNQAVNDAVNKAKKSPGKHSELAAAKALLGMS